MAATTSLHGPGHPFPRLATSARPVSTMPFSEGDAASTNEQDAAEANGHDVADAHGQDAAPAKPASAIPPPEDDAVDMNGPDPVDANGKHATPAKHISQSRYRHTTTSRQPNDDIELRKPTASDSVHTTSSQQTNGGTTPRKKVSFENVGQQIIPEFASFNAKDGFGTNASELQPPSAEERRAARRNLLHRFLLDVLIYMYNISLYDLRRAVVECWPVPEMYSHFGGHTSLLTSIEWNQFHGESQALYKACENVHQGNHSLLTRADQTLIVECIIHPAQDLGVDPAYVCEQLLSYRLHRCRPENRKSTLLYTKTSIWSRTLGKHSKAQKLLASQLVSDDIAVAQLGTDSYEPLRLLLGRAIQEFDQKHCKLGMGKVNREVHAGPKSAALVVEIQWRQAIQARQDSQGRQPPAPERQDSSSTPQSHAIAPWLGIRSPPKSQSSTSLRSRANICSIPEEVPKRPQSTSGLRPSRMPSRSSSLPPDAELPRYRANDRHTFTYHGSFGRRTTRNVMR
jgi:hypothetical protein